MMPETSFVGKHRISLPETSSTNNYAAELLKEDPPEGTLIQTFNQTKGRGQQGNIWVSPPGKNLTFSLIFYPEFLDIKEVFSLSKVISVALCQMLETYLPWENIQIKLPNDILINQKKTAGILIENQLEGSSIKASIIGIGLNVNQTKFPAEIEHRSTSMEKAGRREFDLEKVLMDALSSVENAYLKLKDGDSHYINRMYYQYLYGYQEDIKVIIQGKSEIVSIAGVEKSGKLIIRMNDSLHYLGFKELTFVL